MNNDLISRSALMDKIANHDILKTTRIITRERRYGFEITKSDMFGYVVKAPTVDTEPVRHGRWVEEEPAVYRCSECGFTFTSGDPIKMFAYCRCGCKMDVE